MCPLAEVSPSMRRSSRRMPSSPRNSLWVSTVVSAGLVKRPKGMLSMPTTEMSAGLGLAVGLLTPIPAAGFVSLMLVAAWTVHRPNGFFIVKEGWEYNLILAVSAVAVATIGPGKFSLDYALFRTSSVYDFLHGWWGLLISAGLGLAGGIGQLVIFWRPPAKADAS